MKNESVLIKLKNKKEVVVARKNIIEFKMNKDDVEMKYKNGVLVAKNVLMDFRIKETKKLNKDNFYKKLKLSDIQSFVYEDDYGIKFEIVVKDNLRKMIEFYKNEISMRFIED